MEYQLAQDGQVRDMNRYMHVTHPCMYVCVCWVSVSSQESTRHTEAMDAITTYLGYGSYAEWDEDKRIQWLVTELQVSE